MPILSSPLAEHPTTMEHIQEQEILPRDTDSRMARAAAALCALKLRMDREARDHIGQPYLDDWMGRENSCAYWGDSLLRLVMPFLGWEPHEGERFQAMVDPRFVLGASIKGLPEHIQAHEVAERVARYATPDPSPDQVLYVWYRPIGLLTAHEGKHRVAFMRAHNQPAIAAWVQEATYPAADRIVLVQPSDDGHDEWLALLDGRYVQVLRRPRVSRMMLHAYGVRTCRWRDLPDLPDEQRVRQEIHECRLHRSQRTTAENARTLDLETVRKRMKEEATEVVRSVHDLAPLRFDWRRYLSISAACLPFAFLFTRFDNPVMQRTGWIFAGTAIGLALGLHLVRFTGPRGARLDPCDRRLSQ